MNSRFLTLAFLLLSSQLFAQNATLTERLRYHVYYLADDSLEGRLTGTRGEEKAKAYISKSFAEIGLKPAGDAGSWYQAFTFTSKQELGKSELKLGKMRLRADEDYLVLPSSASGTVSGKLVQVGYGIRNVKLSHDDYPTTVDVKGKIALVQLGSPDGNNPHGKFGADATIEAKVALAKSLGAIGVIFYRTDSTTMLPEMRLDRRTQTAGLPAVCIKAPVKAGLPKVAAFSTEIIKTSTTGHNVAGFINNGAVYTVVIGAHYDHLGDGSLGGSLHAGKGAIHNGADDNASGTAGLIELARALKERKDKRFNYLFLAFSGEELGLLGSAYFAKNATVPIDKVSCMLNMDMIGRLDTATLQLGVNGTGTSPFWKQVVDTLAGPLKVKTTESGNGASDHTSFYLQNIPVLHFFTGTHRDYHKPEDDADKINFEGQAEVLAYMLRIINALPAAEKLAFTKTSDADSRSAPRFKVTLGVMPDYFYEGRGVKIDGATEGKPGAKAGLKAGDIILQIGDYKVSDMQAYMQSLAAFEKGQKTKITVLRDKQEVVFDLEF
jgi:aminopeptidase YwaD